MRTGDGSGTAAGEPADDQVLEGPKSADEPRFSTLHEPSVEELKLHVPSEILTFAAAGRTDGRLPDTLRSNSLWPIMKPGSPSMLDE